MKKSFKNVMASLMAVVSLAVVTGIGTCAANSFNGAKCSSKVIYGITNYRGEGYADGSTFKVVSGYMNTSGGKVYASGSTTWKETSFVPSPATSGCGEFTMSFNNTSVQYR